jgi:hypothetical protein
VNLSDCTFATGSHLARLGELAFAGCPRLPSICLPSSVEAIPNSCFSGCHSLSQVTFEAGSKVSRLGEGAFSSCSSLQSICIPAAVEAIGSSCFNECNKLASIVLEPDGRLSGQYIRDLMSHCNVTVNCPRS